MPPVLSSWIHISFSSYTSSNSDFRELWVNSLSCVCCFQCFNLSSHSDDNACGCVCYCGQNFPSGLSKFYSIGFSICCHLQKISDLIYIPFNVVCIFFLLIVFEHFSLSLVGQTFIMFLVFSLLLFILFGIWRLFDFALIFKSLSY